MPRDPRFIPKLCNNRLDGCCGKDAVTHTVESTMKPTKFDDILTVALLTVACICFGLLCLLRSHAVEPLVAVVSIDGTEYSCLPLDTNATVTLPTGHVVEVKDGEVSVLVSPCATQRCVHTMPAHSIGSTIVCAPERVTITVTEDTAE